MSSRCNLTPSEAGLLDRIRKKQLCSSTFFVVERICELRKRDPDQIPNFGFVQLEQNSRKVLINLSFEKHAQILTDGGSRCLVL
jgi:hypothetical protein